MTEASLPPSGVRAGLIEALRSTRAVERDVMAAIEPARRDAEGADGGWSPKDTLAHLSAWRQRQTEVLAAVRQGHDEPPPAAAEIDDVNAIFHAQRADWAWERVATDAESTADGLMAEVAAASDETLADPKVVGSIMGDGPEHDLGHLVGLAPTDALRSLVIDLAATTQAIVDSGGWPARAAAYARYNLACFHALGGRLETARTLLRQALPAQEELRAHAPTDDDLIALRDEIPALAAG
jgi:hypothetical protein